MTHSASHLGINATHNAMNQEVEIVGVLGAKFICIYTNKIQVSYEWSCMDPTTLRAYLPSRLHHSKKGNIDGNGPAEASMIKSLGSLFPGSCCQ